MMELTKLRTTRTVRSARSAAFAGLLGLALLGGCKSKEQAAVDQAKDQAAKTGVAQQVQYIDANGDTVTTTVQPPVPGQVQQVATAITPAPPGPKPARTRPVVAPYGQLPVQGANTAPNYNGAPTPPPNGQTSYGPGAPVNTASGPNAPPPPPQGQTYDANGQPYNSSAPPNTGPGQPGQHVDIRVPAGTSLAIRINQHISVKTSHAGDSFSGEVAEPVEENGSIIIPRGTHVAGRIDEAHRRGHFKGASILELRLTSMELNGNSYRISTHDNIRTKKGKGKRTAGFIGGMTGAGMLIGGLAGGGVGLAAGGAAGAGAGTLLAGTTGNRDLEIPAESIVRFRLADSLYIQD
jgi:hypothetical protein